MEQSKVEENSPTTLADDQNKMLCNVIVQATHQLVNVQQKTRDEVKVFLLEDCRTLSDAELGKKVRASRTSPSNTHLDLIFSVKH